MKAGIFFTGTGPIAILTTHNSLTDENFIRKLSTKGIKKFIAFEISEDLVKERYGRQFRAVMGDLHQSDDLRVLDYDGHHIFKMFSLNELDTPVYYEN